MDEWRSSVHERVGDIIGILTSIFWMTIESFITIFKPSKYGKATMSLKQIPITILMGVVLFQVMIDLYIKDRIHGFKPKNKPIIKREE